MGPSRGAVALLALISFLAGGVGGLLVDWYVLDKRRHPPGEFSRTGPTWRQDQRESLRAAGIELTGEQKQKLEKVLDQAHDDWRLLVRIPNRRYHEQYRNRVRAILNDEQRALYEKMLAEHDRRRRAYYESDAHGGRGGDGNGSGTVSNDAGSVPPSPSPRNPE